MLWQVLIISSIFILGLLYYQKKLYQLNNVLGEKIKDAIEENRKKDNLIFHQNKMATIGEMVGNIAHQWRQPLAKVSMIQNYTLSKLNNNPAVEKDILDEIKDSQKSLQFMSETINTFQNMYGNNNIQDEIFEAKNATERVLDMLKETLHLNSIIINKKYDNELLLKGNLNSFAQIILAILQNSIYFLKIRDIQKSEIVIKIIKFEEKVKIIISDNAGGTENKNIDKIFDYGFSVRDNNKSSTGIGLYISKLITKEKFNGEIFVRNIEKGLEFTILLPSYNHVN